jgi:hypothetical protein
MPLQFTVLDLSTELPKIVKGHMKMGFQRYNDQKKLAIYNECKAEIDRQVAIYNREQTAYSDSVEERLGQAKLIVKQVESDVAKLTENWDEQIYQSLPLRVVDIALIKKDIQTDANELVKHQDFRQNDCFGKASKDVEALLGKDSAKKLTEHYKKGRANGITMAGLVKGKRLKLDEYHTRAEDFRKTTEKLKDQAEKSSKQLSKTKDRSIEELETTRNDISQSLQAMQSDYERLTGNMDRFIKLANPDETAIKVAQTNREAIVTAINKHKPKAKTAKILLKNLTIKLKPHASSRTVKTGLKAIETDTATMDEVTREFLAMNEQFEQKLTAVEG